MTWEIRSFVTGDVILDGPGNLSNANLRGADLREANLGEANLRGADLREANLGEANLCLADLGEADLGGANLGRANLCLADLGEADLGGANLGRANLGRANLRRAYLRGASLGGTCVIDIGQRSDGFQFYLQLREDDEPLVLAGCRYFPISKAREHWAKTRGGSQLGDESQALLDHGERLASIRRAAQ
jgi:uncharacterized protein YjbI with pentapeptide repeats